MSLRIGSFRLPGVWDSSSFRACFVGGMGWRGGGDDNDHRARRQLPTTLLLAFCQVGLAPHVSGACVAPLGSSSHGACCLRICQLPGFQISFSAQKKQLRENRPALMGDVACVRAASGAWLSLCRRHQCMLLSRFGFLHEWPPLSPEGSSWLPPCEFLDMSSSCS